MDGIGVGRGFDRQRVGSDEPDAPVDLDVLAVHPLGVHPNVLGGAVWPRGVTTEVRDATIEVE